MAFLFGNNDPPPPPDPYRVAAAQGSANVQTAIANHLLQPNQVGPYGSQTITQTGTKQIMGADGKPVDVPLSTVTTKLSPAQQQILNQQNAVKTGMLGLAGSQVNRLGDVLGAPLNFSGLPQGGQLPTSGPQFKGLQSGPNLANLTNAGLPLDRSLNLGNVSTSFAPTGRVDQSVGPQDWSADRLRVEQAIRNRANPQLEQRGAGA